MKLFAIVAVGAASNPAAFRRLCVETRTLKALKARGVNQPPSGGCVLKLQVL